MCLPPSRFFPPPSGFTHGPLPWLCSGGPWCITRNPCVPQSVTTLKSHGPHLTRIGPQAKTESFSLSCLSLPNQTMFLHCDGFCSLSGGWGLKLCINIRYGYGCQGLVPVAILSVHWSTDDYASLQPSPKLTRTAIPHT
jgi:hypothetical protein